MRIVRTRRYIKDMDRIGATEADMRALETEIAANPTAGDVIRGLGGLRKIRFGLRNQGKRGGGRAVYFLMMADETAVMVMAFAKNEQSDLTSDQRKSVLDLMRELKGG